MATLKIHRGQQCMTVDFAPPRRLSELLAQADAAHAHPCGGRGLCGKCAVAVHGNVSAPNAAERRCSVRLSCQAVITGDAEVTLPSLLPMTAIEGGSAATLSPLAPMEGRYGAAIDIGTTTLALLLYDLHSGCCLGAATMLNPQTSVSADVIGRIDAALHGKAAELQQQVHSAVMTLLSSACGNAGIEVSQVASMVMTGNTTMLYLLTARDPGSLARAPFSADCLFGQEAPLMGRKCYLPPCLHAFVGADTTCALLASGMYRSGETVLLCDVGTNGELALWHRGQLYIASTAAGPAFEGAGISCGCTSTPGAIDQVEVVDGELRCHTISGKIAVGVCGSGLLDAIAAMLDTGALDETGFLEEDVFPLAEGVSLTQGDIRAVQLAKAATHAGIMCLLDAAGCTPDDVSTLYLAGGFGSHLNMRSAVRVGLIPAELASRARSIGNAALDGAALLLMNTNLRKMAAELANTCHHIRLDGNAAFSERYVESMLFCDG